MKSDFRVFLTNPPLRMAEAPLQYHRPLVPLGLGQLGAIVENAVTNNALEAHCQDDRRGRCRYQPSGAVAAQDNMLLSFCGQFNLEVLLDRISAFFSSARPEYCFIGLSVLSDGRRNARSMLRTFRAQFPRATLLVGGPHATFMPLDFYEDPETRTGPLADFVVRNEAERVIMPILRRELDIESQLQSACDLGIVLNQSDYSDPEYRIIDGGQFGSTGLVLEGHALDALPVPAYFLFEDRHGRLPYAPDGRYGLSAPAGNINSSRGCPHHCTFCSIPRLAPGYRTLSPGRIVEIVGFLRRYYGIESLFFREDNFMYSGGGIAGDRWPDVLELCERLVEGAMDVRWAIEARADNLLEPSGVPGKDRLDLMKRAGLTGVYVGVESGSDVMLKRLAKGTGVAQMAEVIDACTRKDLAIVATSLYMDPDLLMRSEYPHIDVNDPTYMRKLVVERKQILGVTRAFMDAHELPLERREEYAMVGVPISATYLALEKARRQFPHLVEHIDPESRYIYPKGFRWWSDAVYNRTQRVRSYFGYDYVAEPIKA